MHGDQRREEHARAREQHERARNLGCCEHPQATVRARCDPDPARGQAQAGGRVRRRQARNVRQQDGRGHRQTGADPEHARIDRDLERANGEASRILRDQRDERPRHDQTQHRAGPAEHQAFGQQGAAERAGAGAQRGPHGQLAFPTHRTGEDQVGDVRTSNDEHDRCGGKEHEQDRSRGRGDLIAELRRCEVDVRLRRIRFGVLAHHRRVDRRQFGARGFERRTGRQAAEQVRHPMDAVRDHRRSEVMGTGHHVGDDLGIRRIRY